MSIKAIARRLGVVRNTVGEALQSAEPPRYRRAGSGSLVDKAEPESRQLLGEFPAMPTTVIAERLGWAHGMTILKERVRELRPLFQPPDPSQRTSCRPASSPSGIFDSRPWASPSATTSGPVVNGGRRVRLLEGDRRLDGAVPAGP